MAHYFITGHTGFKGTWLSHLLLKGGHEVSGLSLDPDPSSLFERSLLSGRLSNDFRGDIRDLTVVRDALEASRPDYLIHFAAQALVKQSFTDPIGTYETNVTGTLNVLNAARSLRGLRAQIIVTTDKVYRPSSGKPILHSEEDALGGDDPYSNSKAMADLLAQEFLARRDAKPGAVARAGNVVGAGDISSDRLLPDLVRAVEDNKILELRFPAAVRPWQHVLDCLEGYMKLLQAVELRGVKGAFNFGPAASGMASVSDVVAIAQEALGDKIRVGRSKPPLHEENPSLMLDSSKARRVLEWESRVPIVDAVIDAISVWPSYESASVIRHLDNVIENWVTRKSINLHA